MSPNAGEGLRGSQPMSTAVNMEPKYTVLWISNSIYNLLLQYSEDLSLQYYLRRLHLVFNGEDDAYSLEGKDGGPEEDGEGFWT